MQVKESTIGYAANQTAIIVRILQDGAMNILQDLSKLHLIRIDSRVPKEAKVKENASVISKFWGDLKVSDERYEEMQNQIKQGRDEWEYRNLDDFKNIDELKIVNPWGLEYG